MTLSEEAWDKVMDVNFKSVFLMSKAIGKYMIEQKSGRNINVASALTLSSGTPYGPS